MIAFARWIRERPLPIFLCAQALMYFWNLSLLSPWYDEADELLFLRTSLATSIAIPASGGHPPLYFAIVYYWLRIPLGLSWEVQARALSVLFGLAATVVADRLWARTLRFRWRIAFLSLWTFSPFLLLYCRMSRSYSFQLLVGTAAAGYLLRYLQKPERRTAVALTAWLAIGVYVHPIPGFALLFASTLLLLRARRIREAVAIDAIVGVAFLPCLFSLLGFLPTWSAHGNHYELTGRGLIELGVKFGYWAFSFLLGEAVPDAVLILGIPLGLAVAILLFAGCRRRPDLFRFAAAAGIVAFIGVARWTSYPFVPARMIFLFPAFLMLAVAGAQEHRRIGPPLAAGMLALGLCGIWNYFHLSGFRNKQYPFPNAAVAARIQSESTPEKFAVIVDSTNADPFGLEYQIGPPLETGDPEISPRVDRLLADPNIRTIWFLRSTHDVSAGGLDASLEGRLASVMRKTAYPIEPFTPLEIRVARLAGIPDPPRYFQELLRFDR